MRFTRQILITSQIIGILFLAGQNLKAQEAADSAETDRFTVSGILLGDDGAPLVDVGLYMVEADSDTSFGRRTINLAIASAVATARTNDKGEFLFEVDRSQFGSEKIMFAIIFRVSKRTRGLIKDKDGRMVFEVGDEAKEIDLGERLVKRVR